MRTFDDPFAQTVTRLMRFTLLISIIAVAGCARIDIAPSPITIPQGHHKRPKIEVQGISQPTVTFTSSNTAVATVDSTGLITGVSLGNATVTVTSTVNTDISNSVVVTVIPPTHEQMVTSLINTVCPNVDELQLEATNPVKSNLPLIHEYHDCQKLIEGGAYRGLVGIFAHANVDSFQLPTDFAAGRLVAVIVNFAGKDKHFIPYASLGIADGTSCLVMKYDTKWHAGIVSRGKYDDCPDTLTWADVPSGTENYLTVSTQVGAFSPAGDNVIPPVARWDWDSVAGKNYIGLKCDENTWCEIGPDGFRPSVPLRTAANNEMIKGYYDQQFLADTTGSLTRVWGTITPGAALVSTTSMRLDGSWYEAAKLVLRIDDYQSIDAFNQYLNFFEGKMTIDVDILGRRFGRYALMVRSNPNSQFAKPPHMETQLSKKKAYFRNHPSSKANHTPVVRWRWLNNDESVWHWCVPEGCCEIVDN